MDPIESSQPDEHLPHLSVAEVAAAVREGRYGAEYQPIVSVGTGEVLGFEALSRFHAEDGAPISPAVAFAALHRQPALLFEIELEMKRFQLAHAPPAPLHLNLDPDSFAAGWRLDGSNALLDLLAAPAPAPRVVEVIENVTVSDAVQGRALVAALRRRALCVALDDIGAPDTLLSLEALQAAAVWKLDRSWVARASDPGQLRLLEALVALAVRLDKRTVLEGVETADHLRLAEALGVDAVQGFLHRERFTSARARAAPALPRLSGLDLSQEP
ncbi:EAL domain-containing protein [Anaeromyxobacter paludicola]|nr:EAL domain-containing protein [Anaeromyxobacter paludicola]